MFLHSDHLQQIWLKTMLIKAAQLKQNLNILITPLKKDDEMQWQKFEHKIIELILQLFLYGESCSSWQCYSLQKGEFKWAMLCISVLNICSVLCQVLFMIYFFLSPSTLLPFIFQSPNVQKKDAWKSSIDKSCQNRFWEGLKWAGVILWCFYRLGLKNS